MDLPAILEPYRAALEGSIRPVCRITVGRREVAPWSSKLGGAPYLPLGATLPTGPTGNTLVFLAQINFSELPPMAGHPAGGLVQFFIDDDDLYGANFSGGMGEGPVHQENYRVVYWDAVITDAAQLQVVSPAPAEYTPHDPGTEFGLSFALGEEAVSTADVAFQATIGMTQYELAELLAEQTGRDEEAIADEIDDAIGGAGHKVGGYPYFTQEDPREAGSPLRLLLQLDSDDECGLIWGDAGVGAFFIDPARLANADFSQVLYNWDCG